LLQEVFDVLIKGTDLPAVVAARFHSALTGQGCDFRLREIINERTSDKMRAARCKGKWLGGPPILGYDVNRERYRLVVNSAEAEMVRELFNLYLQQHSLLKTAQEADRRGWSTKSWVTKKGGPKGGGRFDKAKLQRILTNIT
jgi:site-specific DNA recombinase